MRTSFKKLSIVHLLCSGVILFSSCSKYEKCDANCIDVWISGQVFDTSSNKGKASVPVKVYWYDAFSYSPTNIDVGKGKTDANGNFHFKVTVDSTWFGPYSLVVEIPVPEGYICNGWSQNTGPEYDTYSSMFDKPSDYQNIRFIIYQGAKLTIRLTRTSTTPFLRFEMGYVYSPTHNGLYTTDYSSSLASWDFNVHAGANVYTKVDWTKYIAPGQVTYFTDSIKCLATVNNVMYVNY